MTPERDPPHTDLDTRLESLVRRIGYLTCAEPYETGDVDPQVFERLCELSQNPIQPWATGGVHTCDLCRFTIGGFAKYKGLLVSSVSSCVEVWIPGEGFLYCCPTSITHYIDCHGYSPPQDFCAAVLRCSPMRSTQYLKALLANGGRELGFGKSPQRL